MRRSRAWRGGALPALVMVMLLARVGVPVLKASAEAPDATLLSEARSLATRPYEAPSENLPPPFADLSYDAYRAIRPIAGRAAMLPLGHDFAADLLPPGLYFPYAVRIDWPTEEGGFAARPFAPDLFSFSADYFDAVPAQTPGAGFSGMRLRYPLNRASVLDEVLVVQGATYFRAIGQAMVYGLSSRAVAIGTGGPGAEEFPRFRRLRVHPAKRGRFRMEALIDSPSLTGHFALTLRPGKDADAEINLTILPRRDITDIGIAPLNSMYLKGPMRAAVSDDFRPRVHDSDVLLVENHAGERLWRPLSNPARVETSAFLDQGTIAYGLWQTARRFADFEDSEARYHDRPSARVVPDGDWGPGAVMLVEIPTGDEFLDNIVAFWRPAEALTAGTEYRFSYRLAWTRRPPLADGNAAIRQSRSGREHDQPGTRRFVIDFTGVPEGLRPEVSAPGEVGIRGVSLFSLPEKRGTRVTFLMTPGNRDSVDLRLVLRDEAGSAQAPVWLYRWTRARDGGV